MVKWLKLRADDYEGCLVIGWVFTDLLMLVAGFLLAYWVRFVVLVQAVPPVDGHIPPLGWYLPLFGLGSMLCLVAFAVMGAYRIHARELFRQIGRLWWGMLFAYGVVTMFLFGLKVSHEFSRVTIGMSLAMQALLLAFGRIVDERLFRKLRQAFPPVPAIAVGDAKTLARIDNTLKDEVGYECVGRVNSDEHSDHDGLLAAITRALDEKGGPGALLVMGGVEPPPEFMSQLIFECEKRLVELKLLLSFHDLSLLELELEEFGDMPVLTAKKLRLDYLPNRFIKRGLDIVGAAVGLLLGGPMALASALLVKAESRGPLFYVQERCGKNGHAFSLYKVRTMVPQAEAETGPVWASPDDPRRTRIGSFLRRFSIDEMPQFWNVLKGDMSLVGPRPERPHFVSRFREEFRRYMIRHKIKPGLTGWAQVNGWRGDSSIEKRLEHDLYYLANWGILFDIEVILLTLFHVLKGKHAY